MTSSPAVALASRRFFVHPGALHVYEGDVRMTTVVGSCVVVCLRDCEGRGGGMVHFLLPHGAEEPGSRLRYANHAIPTLITRVWELSHGCALQAKIAGGASVLRNLSGERRRFGEENVESARRLLADAGIEILAEAVGGEHGRKITYAVANGSMTVENLGAGNGT